MLIIWGLRTSLRLLGMVTVACTHCHNPAAHRVEERRRVLTLFFVPLLPMGRKVIMTCSYCGLVSEVPADQVPTLLAQAQPAPGSRPGAFRPGGRLTNGNHSE